MDRQKVGFLQDPMIGSLDMESTQDIDADNSKASDSSGGSWQDNSRTQNSSNAMNSQISVENLSPALASCSSSVCSAASVIFKQNPEPPAASDDQRKPSNDSLGSEQSPPTETTSVSDESPVSLRLAQLDQSALDPGNLSKDLAKEELKCKSQTSPTSPSPEKQVSNQESLEALSTVSEEVSLNTDKEPLESLEAEVRLTEALLTKQKNDYEPRKQSNASGTSAKDLANLTSVRKTSLKSPIDCPYVHDLLVISPNPNESPVQPTQNIHQSRISHDDTMEAIEEDEIEVDEVELHDQQQPRQQHDTSITANILNAPLPPGFGGSMDSLGGRVTPADSIREEQDDDLIYNNKDDDDVDVDENDDNDGEESSISVSQHGVLISQDSMSPKQMRSQQERAQFNEEQQASDSLTLLDSGAQSKNVWPVKSISNESGTRAILEHISKHNQGVSGESLEPAPESRAVVDESVDADATLVRRKSWRKSQRPQRDKQASSDESKDATLTEPIKDDFENKLAEGSETGTMRRRRQAAKQSTTESIEQTSSKKHFDPTEEPKMSATETTRSAIIRRGPPLKQLKSLNRSDNLEKSSADNPKPEASNNDSICSSCSCPDGESDKDEEETKQQQVATKTADPKLSRWSHEEGTVFTENYWLSHWLYICEQEESEVWRRVIDIPSGDNSTGEQFEHPSDELIAGLPKEMNEFGSTGSENNFSMKYRSTTRKMIHRRATVEMYNRITNNTLKCEKRVEISRSNGEFGFRIHGSRPVVVSAIERGTSAETCGLEVGDLIYAINGTNILDMAHSDVVKLAHSGK